MLNKKSLVLLSLAALVVASCAFSVRPRIINGETAAPGQFPYYVLVRMVHSDGYIGHCGGSLINDQWILTAAHCVLSHDTIDYFEVNLGAWNSTNGNEEGRVVLTTIQSFPHPEANLDFLKNDVALLKLDEPVEFSETIQAIQLTEQASLEPGTSVTAIGFGLVKSNYTKISNFLQYAEMATISFEQCGEAIFPLKNQVAREDIFCALGENMKSVCNGDSGDPLVTFKNDIPTLVGSTSFSFGKCGAGSPGGFANTYYFLPWIQQTIASNDE